MSNDTHGTSFLDEDLDFDMLLEDDPIDEVEDRPRRANPLRRSKPRDAYRPARFNGNPNWSRIAAAAFVGIVVLFVLFFGVTSFLNHRKQAAYENYFTSARELAVQSDAQGQELDSLLSQNGGVDRTQLVARLSKLADQSATLAQNGRKLSAPDAMKTTNDWLVATLDYRHNGLVAERKALTAALIAKDHAAAANTVAAAGQRLVASDVIYADSFATVARQILATEGVDGVRVYDSRFVKNPEIASPKNVAIALDRLRLAAPAAKVGKDGKPVALNDGKVHGGSLTATTMVPSGQTLSSGGVTKITSSAQLAFEVTFTNQGQVQETNVPVTVSITGDNISPVNLSGVIDTVDPGQTGSVRIPLTEVPAFGEQLTVKVTAGPVPGEKNVDNNSASYPVMFSLGG